MAPVGALLWRSLRVYQVYGANTGVGKTIFTTLLCNAAKEHWQQERVAYLKPVSTGPSSEADDECEFSHAPPGSPAPRLPEWSERPCTPYMANWILRLLSRQYWSSALEGQHMEKKMCVLTDSS